MAIAASVVNYGPNPAGDLNDTVMDYGPTEPCPDCGANPDGDPDDTITVCRCHEAPVRRPVLLIAEVPVPDEDDDDVQTACAKCGRVRVEDERRCPAPCYGEQKPMTRAERNALD